MTKEGEISFGDSPSSGVSHNPDDPNLEAGVDQSREKDKDKYEPIRVVIRKAHETRDKEGGSISASTRRALCDSIIEALEGALAKMQREDRIVALLSRPESFSPEHVSELKSLIAIWRERKEETLDHMDRIFSELSEQGGVPVSLGTKLKADIDKVDQLSRNIKLAVGIIKRLTG